MSFQFCPLLYQIEETVLGLGLCFVRKSSEIVWVATQKGDFVIMCRHGKIICVRKQPNKFGARSNVL